MCLCTACTPGASRGQKTGLEPLESQMTVSHHEGVETKCVCAHVRVCTHACICVHLHK